ncbi:unnamed protein product, partial [Prorocentrum cordatum]
VVSDHNHTEWKETFAQLEDQLKAGRKSQKVDMSESCQSEQKIDLVNREPCDSADLGAISMDDISRWWRCLSSATRSVPPTSLPPQAMHVDISSDVGQDDDTLEAQSGSDHSYADTLQELQDTIGSLHNDSSQLGVAPRMSSPAASGRAAAPVEIGNSEVSFFIAEQGEVSAPVRGVSEEGRGVSPSHKDTEDEQLPEAQAETLECARCLNLNG